MKKNCKEHMFYKYYLIMTNFKYDSVETPNREITTIKCNFIYDELNYNLELDTFYAKSNYEVDDVIKSMTCEDNLTKIYFNYNNKLVITNGKINFGNDFTINLTSKNKEMFIKFLEYIKPYICVKHEYISIELSDRFSNLYNFC